MGTRDAPNESQNSRHTPKLWIYGITRRVEAGFARIQTRANQLNSCEFSYDQ